VREQETLVELFSCSVITKRLLPNDGALDNALEEAVRFWTEDLPGEELRQL
jgi:hypothetical protein